MPTIFLEFEHQSGARAANGSDITMWIDGRWGISRQNEAIYRRVEALRTGPFGTRYSKQKFVGYVETGMSSRFSNPDALTRRMRDLTPPVWEEL